MTLIQDIGNPSPSMGHAHKYGGVILVNGITTLHLLITGSLTTICV